eukprot:TRINITY_DN110457_c0_g1_i1.p1 TRINITY_DN110457_c0_g1~~TRINITY_DN110457_c0_g1_i1.p1  ORF type:complete len:231 (+),score=47.60 TRINITY_DN110457_c0_g1_i1:32-694(+)
MPPALDVEGEAQEPSADAASTGNPAAQKVESMISKVFGKHPDADVLIPLALLEVATDDEHRATLEDAVADPHSFRNYAFRMVNAAVPADVEEESIIDDSESQLCPCTPSHRDRLKKQVSKRLDEHSRLDDSIGPEQFRLSGSLTSQLAGLLAEDSPSDPSEQPSIDVDRVPPAEVRKAYLQLARHYHPDKGGDQEMFVALQSAYELLRSDSQGSQHGSLG